MGSNKFLDLAPSDNQGGRGSADFLCNTARPDMPDIDIQQAVDNLVSEFLIGRDQLGLGCFGTSKVETVINRMVDFHRDLSGAFDVVAARVEDNYFPQIRKFVEISLRFGNFLSAGLLPDGIREFGEQDIGGISFKPVGKLQP